MSYNIKFVYCNNFLLKALTWKVKVYVIIAALILKDV